LRPLLDPMALEFGSQLLDLPGGVQMAQPLAEQLVGNLGPLRNVQQDVEMVVENGVGENSDPAKGLDRPHR
jgi:hypothetical protein